MKHIKLFEGYDPISGLPALEKEPKLVVFVDEKDGDNSAFSIKKMETLINQLKQIGGSVTIIDANFIEPWELAEELKDAGEKGEVVLIKGRDRASAPVQQDLMKIKAKLFIDLEFCTLEDIKSFVSNLR